MCRGHREEAAETLSPEDCREAPAGGEPSPRRPRPSGRGRRGGVGGADLGPSPPPLPSYPSFSAGALWTSGGERSRRSTVSSLARACLSAGGRGVMGGAGNSRRPPRLRPHPAQESHLR